MQCMKKANPVYLALLLLLPLLGWAGCDRTATVSTGLDSTGTPSASAKSVADWFDMSIGGVDVRLQVAVQEGELELGLMNRESLAANDGMLFVFPSPQGMNFWMRNTSIPLDIAYFGPDGRLAEVYAAQPYDETIISSVSLRLQYVVEMNQGWFAAHNLRPGARLDLDAVADALKARGFTPVLYGLQ